MTDDKSALGDKCLIRRSGTVRGREAAVVWIDVEGKLVRVPELKVSPDAQPGHTVIWSGGQWSVKRG